MQCRTSIKTQRLEFPSDVQQLWGLGGQYSLYIWQTPIFFSVVFTISFDQIIAQAPGLPHFKGLGMRNLEYEIRICQKIHTKVTITMSMLSSFFFNQTLYEKNLPWFSFGSTSFLGTLWWFFAIVWTEIRHWGGLCPHCSQYHCTMP